MTITIIITMMMKMMIIILIIIIIIVLIPTEYISLKNCFLFVFYADIDSFIDQCPESFLKIARGRQRKNSPSVRNLYGNHAAREKSLSYSSDVQTIQFSLPIIIEETKRLFATRRTATPTDSNWLDTFDVTAA